MQRTMYSVELSGLALLAMGVLAAPATAQNGVADPVIDTAQGEARRPLRIEELLARRGAIRADLSFVYTARADDAVLSGFDTVSLGGGAFLTFPTVTGTEETEADTGIVSGALRYGATRRLELSTRASLVGTDQRIVVAGLQDDSIADAFLGEAGAGLSYQFSDDDATPALIGFADITLAEASDAQGDDYAYGRTVNLGLTTYRVLDPLVLPLTGGVRVALDRDVGGVTIDPGETFYLNPGVAFAVNDSATLTGGVNLRRIGADEVDGVVRGTDRTRAEMEFGLGYGLSDSMTLRAAARSDVVGDGGFTAVLSLSRKFGG